MTVVPDEAASQTRNAWVGRPIDRVEDAALLTGAGRFVDDLTSNGMLHAAFVRSTVASGRIRAVDVAPALAVEGVVAAFSAKDFGDIPPQTGVLDHPWFVPTETPVLAYDRVRHEGEPIALVLAESPYSAMDGAEQVVVEIDADVAVASIRAALADGAPPVHESAGGNIVVDATPSNDPTIASVFESAHVIAEGTFSTGRLSAAPLELRGCMVEWDARDDRMVVHSTSQMPHLVRSTLASRLAIPEHQIRVITPDVGGGFGQKGPATREEVLVAECARRLHRPVKWIEDRRENLMVAPHGHESSSTVQAAFDRDGALLGIVADMETDVGAYSVFPFTYALEPMLAARELPGVYRVPRYHVRTKGVSTNKSATGPYRGVSRPQAVFIMERLMDKAARKLGISSAEIRLRNVIREADFPYAGITGVTYEPGSYKEALERCLEAVEYDAWPEEQARARAEGRLLGLGLACFSESGGFSTATFAQRRMQVTPGYEMATATMDPNGFVTVAVGTCAHGQGHQTTFAQIAADRLQVDIASVRVVEGDTDAVPFGWGTFASRSTVAGGAAVQLACDKVAAKVVKIAAHLLEASEADVELCDGHVRVNGSPHLSVDVREVARVAYHAATLLPDGVDPGLRAEATFDPPGAYSNATHAVIAEVSPRTGLVSLLKYVVVEDCGTVLNPKIVDGQILGGLAQGIGKALYERVVYGEQGEHLSTTLTDYLVPTAAEMPLVEIHHLSTPYAATITGAKGMAESGLIGAPAAIANAVSDALAHLELEVDSLPILPEDLAAAIASARPSS